MNEDDPAERHRPTDAETLRREAHKLKSQGLTPHDIGAALGLGLSAVRRLLTEGETND